MRISLLLILGLFIQTSIFAQTEQDQPATESIEQELQKQLEGLSGIFGGGIDTMLLKGLNLEDLENLNLENLNLENLNLEDLMNGKMDGFGGMDMEAMMKMMEQSLQGMDLGNIEELLGPLMGGELGKIFPQQEGQEEQENAPLGEDGKPVQKKKKKSTKKVYKL